MGERIDHVVARWARSTPDAPAVSLDGRDLGYAELVDRADAVATTLLRQGIQPGDVVATALDRSADLVVALLGILRAGATAVALDPTWPAWRREDVLDLASVRAVLHADLSIDVLRPSSGTTSEDAACVVVSTGARPHCVVVTHQEVLDAPPPLGGGSFTHELWASLLTGDCFATEQSTRDKSIVDFDLALLHNRIALVDDLGEIAITRPDGYLRTGYIGERDDRGAVRLLGRRSDLVRLGDRWIDPEPAEAAVLADPRVSACVAFPYRGTLTCAYTTPDGRPLPDLPPLHVRNLPAAATLRVSYESLHRELDAGSDSLLAEIRGLLGNAALEPDDDLLDAGMTSLAAVRIATALSARSGRKITVGDVYRQRRLSAFAVTTPGPAAVPQPDDPDHRPLAHAQKRFLFAEAYAPGSADNLLVEAYELDGPLRPDVLRAALGDVVERHEALRTAYTWERGRLVPHVLADEPVPWTDVPPPDEPLPSWEIARRVTADLWDTPFTLDREVPVRARLCRLGPDRAVLCLQFHHIAFDGSSEDPFLADLRHAYAERSRGAAPHFAPAPGYPSLGRAEERSLASWSADDVPYWREVLAHCPPPSFPLPGKGSENEAATGEVVRHLDADAVRRVTLAAAHRAGPPLSALSAGAAMAVARRFDVDDVCVGTLSAGRFDADADQVVGYLVNPFAVPLHGLRRPAGPVLADAARQVVDGLEHARTPFDELVRELRPARDRHPWFEALVVLQHQPPAVSLGPVTLRPLRVPPPRTSRSWLVEAFPDADGGWDLVTTWREDVMDRETGEVLADDLVTALLEIAALDPTGGAARAR